MTSQDLFTKLKTIYSEIAVLEEDVKALKTEGKDAGLDVSVIATLAKAAANAKLSDVEDKANLTLKLIEELT